MMLYGFIILIQTKLAMMTDWVEWPTPTVKIPMIQYLVRSATLIFKCDSTIKQSQENSDSLITTLLVITN